ncbi:MAG: hypothetical protein WCS86_02860 [Candidatus Paceibacterota bacterium]
MIEKNKNLPPPQENPTPEVEINTYTEQENIKYPNLSKIKEALSKQKLELVGDREILSGGIFGPIFRLKVRDFNTNKEKFIIERTFTKNKGISKRFSVVKIDDPYVKIDSEPRYKNSDSDKTLKKTVIIDYLYNEETALCKLQGLNGIPKLYGVVDEED